MSSFVQACVKEALRVFGPVPMGLPRIAPKGGLTIGARTIPEGTIVSINRESKNLDNFVQRQN
jgi:cytochrome P450